MVLFMVFGEDREVLGGVANLVPLEVVIIGDTGFIFGERRFTLLPREKKLIANSRTSLPGVSHRID